MDNERTASASENADKPNALTLALTSMLPFLAVFLTGFVIRYGASLVRVASAPTLGAYRWVVIAGIAGLVVVVIWLWIRVIERSALWHWWKNRHS